MAVKFTSYRAQIENANEAGIARALEICGGKGEGYAKQLCPVDTGNLRNSITHQPVGNHTMAVGTNVYYAPFVELGTVKMGAQPYLRPGIENHAGEFDEIIRSELKA